MGWLGGPESKLDFESEAQPKALTDYTRKGNRKQACSAGTAILELRKNMSEVESRHGRQLATQPVEVTLGNQCDSFTTHDITLHNIA